jgi:hypothetical protein
MTITSGSIVVFLSFFSSGTGPSVTVQFTTDAPILLENGPAAQVCFVAIGGSIQIDVATRAGTAFGQSNEACQL